MYRYGGSNGAVERQFQLAELARSGVLASSCRTQLAQIIFEHTVAPLGSTEMRCSAMPDDMAVFDACGLPLHEQQVAVPNTELQ